MSTTQKSTAPEAPAPVAATAPPAKPAPAPAPTAKTAAPVAAKKVAVARKRPAASPAKAPASPVPSKKAVAKAPVRQRAAPKTAAPVVKKLKQKLVRDSFTMPSADFALIDELKARAIGFKRPAKKSELLRAGLQALAALSDAKLKSVLDGLTPLKAGRPKKSDA